MSSRLKLAGICFAAAFALAACGGGGGTATPAPPTQAELDAAKIAELQGQIDALRTQLGLGADDDLSTSITDLQDELADLKQQAQDEADAAAEAARKAMAATAAKLYMGLEHGLGDTTNVRTGASDAAGVISVTIGSEAAVPLSEDKKAMIADNHGWSGKRHTAEPTGGGTYEAVVYSNVGDPTEGDPFNEQYSGNFDATTGVLDTATTEGTASRVASPSFDQSAGVKTFKLPANTVAVMISGSYHGVSGTYSCVPGADNTCAVRVAASGFDLVGVVDATNAFDVGNAAWTFKPTDPKAKVMSTPDAIYASYGWWIHKAANDGAFTASAFATSRDTVPAATGITALRGTATYMGGAAGKYALTSATGGTNDAGHFTARATLEADFNDDTVSGTIDMFIGADGETRDWSVELMESTVSDGGAIAGDPATTGNTDAQMTKWTIDGTAGAAAGQWSGTLYDNGADSVPQVGNGTFHSTYGTSGGEGRMVGGFGVNKQ